MFEVQLPALKKYQNIAGIAAGVGFVLGALIPAMGMFTQGWHSPFGNGILQTGGFLAITGVGSAVVLGNLVALFLIGLAKIKHGFASCALCRKVSRYVSREERDSDNG